MNQIIFSEFLPINTAKLPQLFAYTLTIGDSNLANTIGGKLSYRLKKSFQGNWVWTNYKIISDVHKTQEELAIVLQQLWKEEPEPFTHLHKITECINWKRTSKEVADFFCKGILSRCDEHIQDILRKERKDLGLAYVERDYELRGWVVNDEPAISVSISSNLIYKKDVKAYTKTLQDPQELLDIWVLVKGQNFKGKIGDIVGTMQEHRQRLLAVSKSEQIQKVIQNASDDELVVKVQVGQNGYDYPVSALNVILMTSYLSKFGVDAGKAINAFRITPTVRHQILKNILQALGETGESLYSSQTHPQLFLTSKDIGFDPKLRLGNNQVCLAEEKSLLQSLQKYGLYKCRKPNLTMGLIDARTTSQETHFGQ